MHNLKYITCGSNNPLLVRNVAFYAYAFLLVIASAVDISVSIHLSSLEASSVIFKDPSLSDNASILFVLLDIVLSCSHSFHYMYFISSTGNSA